MHYIKSLRPINLLIIGATQWLIYRLLFVNTLDISCLHGASFYALMLTTILIAAGGYYINDYYDTVSDEINAKPYKLSKRASYIAYIMITLLGAIIAMFLAQFLQEWPLFWIYPVAVGLLYLYAKTLKGTMLLGNLVVGWFCCFVPGIILVAERKCIQLSWEIYPIDTLRLLYIVVGYMLFGFLTTVWREIIKDAEDVKGDMEAGLNTIAVRMGTATARRIAMIFGSSTVFLLSGVFCLTLLTQMALPYIFLGGLLLVHSIYILVRQLRAVEPFHFRQVSQQIKLFMIEGLISIFALSTVGT